MTDRTGIPGLGEFLCDYPQMALRPSAGNGCLLKGRFAFCARFKEKPEITDSYELSIHIPREFPSCIPTVVENGNKITRNGHFHLNPGDGSLCLGSPIRLMRKLAQEPTLVGFTKACLVPYLFAMSHKLQFGGPWLFDELEHGEPGILSDYADLFGLKSSEQARYALQLLGMKKRRANKYPCPCGCKRRLGRCRFNARLREFRALASRRWFRSSAL